MGSIEGGRSVLAFIEVRGALRSVGTIAAVVGEIARPGVVGADLRIPTETLLHAGLQRVIVRIEPSFERIDGVVARVGAQQVERQLARRRRVIGGGGSEPRGIREVRRQLIDIDVSEQVRSLGADVGEGQ